MAHANQVRTALLAASIAMPIQASADQLISANSNTLLQGSLMVAQLTYIDVIANLENSGYRIIDMRSTFLGRIKLRADNSIHQREVVVSRSTGEILSDVIVIVYGARNEATASSAPGSPIAPGTGGGVVPTGGGGVGVSVGGGVGVGVSVGGGGGGGVSVGTGNGGVNVGTGNGGASVSVGAGSVSVEVGGIGVNLGN